MKILGSISGFFFFDWFARATEEREEKIKTTKTKNENRKPEKQNWGEEVDDAEGKWWIIKCMIARF